MSKLKFTPGPWFSEHYGVHNTVRDVATVNAGIDEREANMRLIVAAPDMYSVLKDFLSDLDGECLMDGMSLEHRMREILNRIDVGPSEQD